MSEDTLIRSYHNFNNVEIGVFTVLCYDTSTNSTNVPGIVVSATSNSGPVCGVAQESIMPSGYSDYVAGAYGQIVSGTAWPSGAVGNGYRNIKTTIFGRSRVLFNGTGTVIPGDRLVIADAYGRVASAEVNGFSITAGTKIYVVGVAESFASVTNDIIYALVKPYNGTV